MPTLEMEPKVRTAGTITLDWLSAVLKRPLRAFSKTEASSNWANQTRLLVTCADGSELQLRLKTCLGSTFDRSEADYYTHDYLTLANAPLVRCHDAQFEPGTGYHILLDDLAATHTNRRDAVPTLAYGLAAAEALGRLHRHHWQSQPAPATADMDRYFAAIRPGAAPLEAISRRPMAKRLESDETQLRARWADARGMTLLHGDLNPENVLTPNNSESPVLFIDRQPFDWSLRYGVAVLDLAYFLAIWWPADVRIAHQETILRQWHQALGRPDYSWAQTSADWRLSVAHCLHVPFKWCADPKNAENMRWLWEIQLERILTAEATIA